MNERLWPAAMAADALGALEAGAWHAHPERVLIHVRRCVDSIQGRLVDLPADALVPLERLDRTLSVLESGLPCSVTERAAVRLELVRRVVALGQVLMRDASRRLMPRDSQ